MPSGLHSLGAGVEGGVSLRRRVAGRRGWREVNVVRLRRSQGLRDDPVEEEVVEVK
jgi:hypothetical protein